ncbi:FAD-binding domain-containing protein [Trametes polyzona]|nr:FAD-binding domain-containing protein [Trametes polyzona]
MLACAFGGSWAASSCRCTSDDPCWPTQADFDGLARQVSQPLVRPTPPALPCYIDANSPECAVVRANWTNGNWRADQPGAMQSPNFEGFIFPNGTVDACFLNTSLDIPCRQGSVPVIGVDARTVNDVQAAVKFAADHNLRLVVRNTGHDFLGRSDGRGSFVIWTHHMRNVTVEPNFRPAGAPDNETYEDAITVGAGVRWHDAWAAAKAAGRIMVSPPTAGGSVGSAGGWMLGGGHSALSPTYGLGVDNVLEITLVTSTGDHLTANAYQNSDLFWALRGGGGGTFGVVTSATYRTHQSVPIIGASFSFSGNRSTSNSAFQQAFAELIRISPELTNDGWGGYNSISSTDDSFTCSSSLLIPNATLADANATIVPYFNFLQALAANSSSNADSLTVAAPRLVSFASFYDWFDSAITGTSGIGVTVEVGSWLLPGPTLKGNSEVVAQTLLDDSFAGIGYYLVAGGAVNEVDPDAMGVNPAWRNATVHAVIGTTWPEGSSGATIDSLRKDLQNRMVNFRALAPDSGAYFNEASLFEPNPRQAFFGSHYDRLREVKRVYDPIDLFVVVEGVGSDEWDSELKCRVQG